jgi:glycosyltransferase involved in cell wall biosynthesis
MPTYVSTGPEYRIFVIACSGDDTAVAETAACVVRNSFRTRELFVIASPSTWRGMVEPDGFTAIALDGHDYDELFAAVLERFADKDAILLRAGLMPPEMWDLRLAWSAVRRPGVATVSPVGEFPLKADAGLIDRLCHHYRQPTAPEIVAFAPECVYVRADAVRAITGLARDLRPAALSNGAAHLRYSHVLADHVYVAARRAPERAVPAPAGLLESLRGHLARQEPEPPALVSRMQTRNLHIMHSWGGGLERWVADYCRADREHENFVLKSVGTWGAFGSALHLYRRIGDAEPLAVWPLAPAIPSTSVFDPAYEAILSQILQEHGIERIVISSLIGHSLEALRRRVPTLLVCHDFYPFCPALNITFGDICQCCDEPRLTACTRENPHHRFFRNLPPSAWLELRGEFARAVKEFDVTLIAPSPSVRELYLRLQPELAGSFCVIPHGVSALTSAPLRLAGDAGRRLRVVVLGSLAPQKGGLLLEQLAPELVQFADLLLAGCGDYGRPYAGMRGITLLPVYERERLPELLSEWQPDLGLLLSVVPETFSYTLQDLAELAVPVLATRMGSFADRIEDGVSGFLCAPDAASALQALRQLAHDREALARVHEYLKQTCARTVADMLRDYEALGAAPYSARAYFAPAVGDAPLPERSLQLFWRTAEGQFREKDSATVAPRGRGLQTIRLSLAEQPAALAQLRLDLSGQPGLLLLHGLRLRDGRERVQWEWNGEGKQLQSAHHSEILFLHTREPGRGALLYLTGNDPFLALPVERAVLAQWEGGGCVEVECSLGSAEDYVAELISLARPAAAGVATGESVQLVRQLTAGLRRAEADLAARNRHIERMTQEVHELESRIVGLQNSLSWRLMRPARVVLGLGLKAKDALANRPGQPRSRSHSAGS